MWGFQFLLILDIWGITFHAAIFFGLGKNLLFKSVLGRCEDPKKQLSMSDRKKNVKNHFVIYHPPFEFLNILSQNLQEWWDGDTRYFCTKGRCIIQSCTIDDDCPGGDEGQCIDESCLIITTCIDDGDCGGFLICGKSESEEVGTCRPEDVPPPECIESSECPPVSNLIFSSYPFPLFPCLLLFCPFLP
jgi:hypothetical protein